MKSVKSQKLGRDEPQIVIVGGGGAGLAAAVTAAARGVRVVVVEKRRVPGGNTNLANVMFGAETPFQKRMKIDVPRDFAFKLAMGYAHWKTDPRIVRAFIGKWGIPSGGWRRKGSNSNTCPIIIPNRFRGPFRL